MEDWRCYSVQFGHERSSDKGTFEQRSESSEGVGQAEIWSKRVLCRGNKWEGPEAGPGLVSSRNPKSPGMDGVNKGKSGLTQRELWGWEEKNRFCGAL